MIAKISKCSKFTIVTNGTRGEIMAQQISPDTVSICVQAIDLESGIILNEAMHVLNKWSCMIYD
jgi:wyosine [tRNA(Phe)-imidazoG37] synthetase (radical SAM superfamily)